jgi:cytochrome c oxidase assembly protein subunit 15
MIFLMIVLGALTRLSRSGLSMVEWRPVTAGCRRCRMRPGRPRCRNIFPRPQGKLINRGFGVARFKQIFWLEFIHRLWGRLIGVVFVPPLAWFWVRGKLTPALQPRLAGAAGAGRPARRAGLR